MYLNAGFDDYLAKPVSSRQLWDTVMKYLPAEYLRMGDGEPASGFAVAPKKGVMEQLGEFLDVSSALQYCCDSEEPPEAVGGEKAPTHGLSPFMRSVRS